MILRAIKTAQFEFLYCVFAYNKNFMKIENELDDDFGDD